MFRKDFKVKTNVKTKSSEKRRLVEDLSKYYRIDPLLFTNLFGKSEFYKIKIECHDGTTTTIFNFDDQPLFFEHNKVIIPTVYCLWILYDMLPSFTIYEETSPYITNGSDLMIPGIIIDMSLKEKCYGIFNKRELYTINSSTSRAPLAIGLTNMDSYDMFMAGRRGKALNVLHCQGDFLWAFGKKSLRPEISWEEKKLNISDEEENNNELTEIMKYVNSTDELAVQSDDICAEFDDISLCITETENASKNETIDMNELLETCFLHALKCSLKDTFLPIRLNILYANHVLRFCPDGFSIEIKKTTFKKFGVFMKAMEEEGLVTLTSNKGVDSINTINRSHEKLKFKPSLLFREEEQEKLSEDEYSFPQIEEIFFITDKLYSLLKFHGYKKSDVIHPKELKIIITEYVNKNNLNELNKDMVTLDDTLKSCCLNSKEKITELSWKTLFERIHKNMTPGLVMIFPNRNVTLKNTKKPKIKIQSLSRHNKMITRIEGEDLFCIDQKKLCFQIQQSVGCSCGLVTDKSGVTAIQAQGDQKQRITEILTDQFKVPLLYIDGAVVKKKTK